MSRDSGTFGLFNKKYFEFLNFIKKYMNDDPSFKTFYRKNLIVKETNVKLIIKTWNERITTKYYDQVMERNLDFFLNKSYNDDISTQETPLLKYIDDFKEVYPTLEESIKNEFVDYIMTLTYLSYIYFK
jgi:hypothetical protein